MAYSIDFDKYECIPISGSFWPKAYEFREWHTGRITKYEFKSRADFDEQCENDPEVMRLFKHYKTIKLGVKK